MRVTLAGDNSGLGGALNYLNPLTDRLNKAIEEGSVQLMLNSTVTELVVKDGKCTGVKVGEVEYSAPTTLLATGGYCHNEELLKMAGFDNIVSQASIWPRRLAVCLITWTSWPPTMAAA